MNDFLHYVTWNRITPRRSGCGVAECVACLTLISVPELTLMTAWRGTDRVGQIVQWGNGQRQKAGWGEWMRRKDRVGPIQLGPGSRDVKTWVGQRELPTKRWTIETRMTAPTVAAARLKRKPPFPTMPRRMNSQPPRMEPTKPRMMSVMQP